MKNTKYKKLISIKTKKDKNQKAEKIIRDYLKPSCEEELSQEEYPTITKEQLNNIMSDLFSLLKGFVIAVIVLTILAYIGVYAISLLIQNVNMNEESIDFRGFEYDEIETFFQEVFGFQKEPSSLIANMINKSNKKKYTNKELEKLITKAYMIRKVNDQLNLMI